ncbi:MAG TPA: lipopolysaccharide assembly protein LapA domain-containing protein [Cyanophyceae cyanobacterium]
MKTLTNLLTSFVLAAWISVIAILSIQNITPVSLKFLGAESIQMPIGVVLAFSVGIGSIGGAMLPLFLQFAGRQQRSYADDE